MSSLARFPLRVEWEQIKASGLPAGELNPDAPYVCFPMRSEWDALHPPARNTFPSPLRSSREPENGFLVPPAALKLAEAAREALWEVRVQYSRGYVPHSRTGKPGALQDSIGLVFGRHPMTDRRAWAVYRKPADGKTWSWKDICVYGPELPPFMGCGLADLRLFLAEPARSDAQVHLWVRGLKKAISESEAVRKRKITVRGQIVKVANEGRAECARTGEHDRAEWFRLDRLWREKVAELAEGVFTSDEVAKIIEPKIVTGGMR